MENKSWSINSNLTVLEVLFMTGLVRTKSIGRRVIEQEVVTLNGKTLDDWNVKFPCSGILKVGKNNSADITVINVPIKG